MALVIEIKQMSDIDRDRFDYIKPIFDYLMKEYDPDKHFFGNCSFEYGDDANYFFVAFNTFHIQTLEIEGDFRPILIVLFVLAAYFPQIKLSVNNISKQLIDDIIEYIMVFGIGLEICDKPIDKDGFLNLRIIHIDEEIPQKMIKF